MKLTKLKKLGELERVFLPLIFQKIKDVPRDAHWRMFSGEILYKKEMFDFSIEFIFQENCLSYRKLDISRKPITILLQ